MCWISKTPPVEEIAKVNIPVFKVCNEKEGEGNGVISYYEYFKYELNRTYSISSLSVIKSCCEDGPIVYIQFIDNDGKITTTANHSETITPLEYRIYQGFHSYSSECEYYNQYVGIKVFLENKLVGDYHYHKALVVKGYIPKGAKYYKNANGEIVSDAIVLTECIQ